MTLIVLTPGVKDPGLLADLPQGLDITVYLTNPLFQNIWAKDLFPGARIIEDDDISTDEIVFRNITERAQEWAEKWFLDPVIRDAAVYRDINLGRLDGHALYHEFFGILKPIAYYRIILKSQRPSKILVVDDDSWWSRALRFIADLERIPLRIHAAVPKPALIDTPKKRSDCIKNLLIRINQARLAWMPDKGVLYSCAFKFSRPLLKGSRGNYFLRDDFSAAAFMGSWGSSFMHLLPAYFAKPVTRGPMRAVFDSEKALLAASRLGESGFFSFDGTDLWPLLKEHFVRRTKRALSDSAARVDDFLALIGRVKPRAVVVDEDILPFNRALVACAKHLAIPSYTMLHGVPFTAHESMPSADRVFAWGSSTRERLKLWGMNGDRVIETGAPQYDLFRKKTTGLSESKVRKDFDIATSMKIILLAVSNLHTNEHPNPKYPRISYFKNNLSGAIRSTIRCLGARPDSALIIKSHPGDRYIWFTRQIVEEFPEDIQNRVHVVQNYDTSSLILASDLVLTTGSTVYFEALLLRRPTMIYDYDNFRFCSFMSEEFLNLNEPDRCQATLMGLLELGRDEVAVRQQKELSRHFHGSNESAVINILDILKNSTESQRSVA